MHWLYTTPLNLKGNMHGLLGEAPLYREGNDALPSQSHFREKKSLGAFKN